MQAESVTATLVYTCNASGLRVAQSVNGTLTTFAWDQAAGLPVVISDTAAVYLRTPDGQLLAEQRSRQWTWPLVDSLGSIRQWSSDADYIVGRVEYDPFGTRAQPEGTVSSPYGYTGEYRDAATALIYLRTRYYAPASGRFQQPDPWAGDNQRPQSLNRYVYVENNAVNNTDPTGLRPEPPPSNEAFCENWPTSGPLNRRLCERAEYGPNALYYRHEAYMWVAQVGLFLYPQASLNVFWFFSKQGHPQNLGDWPASFPSVQGVEQELFEDFVREDVAQAIRTIQVGETVQVQNASMDTGWLTQDEIYAYALTTPLNPGRVKGILFRSVQPDRVSERALWFALNAFHLQAKFLGELTSPALACQWYELEYDAHYHAVDRFDFHGEVDWVVPMSPADLPFDLPFEIPDQSLGDVIIPDEWGDSLEGAGWGHSFDQVGDWSHRGKRVILLDRNGTMVPIIWR